MATVQTKRCTFTPFASTIAIDLPSGGMLYPRKLSTEVTTAPNRCSMLLARVPKLRSAQILLASAVLLVFNGCGRAPKEDRASRSVEPPTAQQLPDDQPDYASTSPEPAADAAAPMLETQMIPAPVPMRAPAGVTVTKQYNRESIQRPAMKSRIARSKTDAAFDTQPRVAAMESVAPPALEASQAISAEMAPAEEPLSNFPAGATRQDEQGFATVQVFYATDRSRGALPLSAYEVTGKKQAFMMLAGCSVMLFVFSAFSWLRGKSRAGNISALMASVAGVTAAACIVVGQANIEKHGVTYTSDRGTLTRGICEVTVPDIHERGMVERPSLMRFEIREDQRQHIVLTSAVELSAGDFQQRLSETLSSSPQRDLLVFIHGYNVDFEIGGTAHRPGRRRLAFRGCTGLLQLAEPGIVDRLLHRRNQRRMDDDPLETISVGTRQRKWRSNRSTLWLIAWATDR